MRKADEVFNEFLNLSASEQGRLLSLLKATNDVAPEKQAQGGPEARLYEALRTAHKQALGTTLPPLRTIGVSKTVPILGKSVDWLLTTGAGQARAVIDRKVEVALFTLAAQASAFALRKYAKEANPTALAILLMSKIPSTVESAFPSYRSSGLLLKLAEGISKGQHPIDSNVNLEETED